MTEQPIQLSFTLLVFGYFYMLLTGYLSWNILPFCLIKQRREKRLFNGRTHNGAMMPQQKYKTCDRKRKFIYAWFLLHRFVMRSIFLRSTMWGKQFVKGKYLSEKMSSKNDQEKYKRTLNSQRSGSSSPPLHKHTFW